MQRRAFWLDVAAGAGAAFLAVAGLGLVLSDALVDPDRDIARYRERVRVSNFGRDAVIVTPLVTLEGPTGGVELHRAARHWDERRSPAHRRVGGFRVPAGSWIDLGARHERLGFAVRREEGPWRWVDAESVELSPTTNVVAAEYRFTSIEGLALAGDEVRREASSSDWRRDLGFRLWTGALLLVGALSAVPAVRWTHRRLQRHERRVLDLD